MTSRSTTCAAQDEKTFTWLERLKAACDAGYYRTETCVGEQTSIPALLNTPLDRLCRRRESGDLRSTAGPGPQYSPARIQRQLSREWDTEPEMEQVPWWKRWFR
jgi:hypothetical protein